MNGCERRNPLKEMFLSENVIFLGRRLSLGHFDQKVSKSPVSQLQNGVSTSSVPPFVVYLLTFEDYPSSNYVMSSLYHDHQIKISHE